MKNTDTEETPLFVLSSSIMEYVTLNALLFMFVVGGILYKSTESAYVPPIVFMFFLLLPVFYLLGLMLVKIKVYPSYLYLHFPLWLFSRSKRFDFTSITKVDVYSRSRSQGITIFLSKNGQVRAKNFGFSLIGDKKLSELTELLAQRGVEAALRGRYD